MLKKRTFSCFLCLFIVAFFQASPNNSRAASENPSALARIEKKHIFSHEGEQLYNYLILSEAMNINDFETISSAIKKLLALDPSLELYRDAGTILLNYKQFASLQMLMQQGLSLFPHDRFLTLCLATASAEQGKLQNAVQILESYLQHRDPQGKNGKDPEEALVIEELVRLYLRSKQNAKAQALFPRMSSSQSPQSLYLQAKVLQENKEFDHASRLLLQLSKKMPEEPDVWIELGILAEKQQHLAQAIRYYQKANKYDNGQTDVFFRIISLQLQLKNLSAALKTIHDTPVPPLAMMQAALLVSEHGYPQEALKIMDSLEQQHGQTAEFNIYSSLIHVNDGKNIAKGVEILKKISTDSAAHEEAMERIVRLYLWGEDFNAAHQAALDAIANYPDKRLFWELAAYALAGKKSFPEARELLNNALRLFNNHQDISYILASIEDEAGNKEKALLLMESILAEHPRYVKALNYIGYTLADKNKDLPRALRLLEIAVEEAPQDWYIIDSLAWTLYRLKRYPEAWEAIQEAMALGADEAIVWEHYADIAIAVGKIKEALQGYENALKRNPEKPEEILKKHNALLNGKR